MECNEQKELTRKTASLIESRMTAMVGGDSAGGGGIEQNGKRSHIHGQQCGDCRTERRNKW